MVQASSSDVGVSKQKLHFEAHVNSKEHDNNSRIKEKKYLNRRLR